MAIYAKGATRGYTQKDMITDMIGTPDPEGNPFRVVELRYRKAVANSTKTRGYQDCYIDHVNNKSKLKLGVAGMGNITWLTNRADGSGIGKVVLTKWNIKVLAANYADKDWDIVDEDIDKMIKELSTIHEDSLSPEERAFNVGRRKERKKRSVRAHAPELIRSDIDAETHKLDTKSHKLSLKEIALSKREAQIEAREKNVGDREGEANLEAAKKDMASENEIPGTEQVEMDLSDANKLTVLNVFALKKIARGIGLAPSLSAKKAEIVESIINAQAGSAETVTG